MLAGRRFPLLLARLRGRVLVVVRAGRRAAAAATVRGRRAAQVLRTTDLLEAVGARGHVEVERARRHDLAARRLEVRDKARRARREPRAQLVEVGEQRAQFGGRRLDGAVGADALRGGGREPEPRGERGERAVAVGEERLVVRLVDGGRGRRRASAARLA